MSKGPSLVVHVRHPESIGERLKEEGKSLSGLTDRTMGITAEGLSQANQLGESLRKKFGRFDAVICSTYQRSRQGAAAIMAAYPPEERCHIKHLENPLLDERNVGLTFGLTEEMLHECFPRFCAARTAQGEIRIEYPRGESLLKVFGRIEKFITHEFPVWAGKKLCLVGHWGTHFAFRWYYEDLKEEQLLQEMGYRHPPNCSTLVLAWNHSRKALVLVKE
jgi:broad specificity phosphatase PhoE